MKNRYYKHEMFNEFSLGDAGKSLSKLLKMAKNLFKMAKAGDSDNIEIHKKAKELKTKVEQTNGSSMLKKMLMGIIVSIMTITSAGYAKDIPTSNTDHKQSSMESKKEALFNKLEHDISNAEAKIGNNTGSTLEIWDNKSSSVERLAAVIDSDGDYSVKVTKIKKYTDEDGDEYRGIKFDDGSKMIWYQSGDIQIFDGLGNPSGSFFGSDADRLINKAKAFIANHDKSVSEARNILKKSGYRMIKS